MGFALGIDRLLRPAAEAARGDFSTGRHVGQVGRAIIARRASDHPGCDFGVRLSAFDVARFAAGPDYL